MTYEVYDRDGKLMLSADVRYDTNTEKEMIKSGYKIRLNGKGIK